MDLVVEPLTLAAVIGAVGTFLTAVLTRANWSSNVKRWVAIGVVVVLRVSVDVELVFGGWKTGN